MKIPNELISKKWVRNGLSDPACPVGCGVSRGAMVGGEREHRETHSQCPVSFVNSIYITLIFGSSRKKFPVFLYSPQLWDVTYHSNSPWYALYSRIVQPRTEMCQNKPIFLSFSCPFGNIQSTHLTLNLPSLGTFNSPREPQSAHYTFPIFGLPHP